MEKGQCEQCGAWPGRITEGPFAGSRDDFNYRELCSQDLCPKCMDTETCDQGVLGNDRIKHKAADEE